MGCGNGAQRESVTNRKLTGLLPWLPTIVSSYVPPMGYEITLRDRTVTNIDTADAFSHERTMTTFYRTANERQAVDCWAVTVASIRTDEILMIRSVDAARAAHAA